MRILVVEDEPGIAEFIERGLKAEGYAVTCAYDGQDAVNKALGGDFSLILLDVLLPKKNGIEVLREIRPVLPSVPIIMLTARGEIDNKIEGLDAGASDYIVKPFSFDELLARIRVQLRKPDQTESNILKTGSLTLDFKAHRIDSAGRELRLTAREFDLLAYLMRHPNQVLSRSQILNAVWGYDHDPGTNVLEVYVGYLRRKLGSGSASPRIETVRSSGYRLVSEQ